MAKKRTPYYPRRVESEFMPAQRRKAERARVDAIMAGKAWAKKKLAPLTSAQARSRRAAGLREGFMKGTALGRLTEALKPKKKKKE